MLFSTTPETLRGFVAQYCRRPTLPAPVTLPENTVKIAITKPLFAWDALEDSPSLQSLPTLLETIPDQALLESLWTARGKGRDDYPVEVLWGTLQGRRR